MAEFHTRYFR